MLSMWRAAGTVHLQVVEVVVGGGWGSHKHGQGLHNNRLGVRQVMVNHKIRHTPEMPPQAFIKSPDSSCFIDGGAGEWSDETRLMAPVATAAVSAALLSPPRRGGAHLNCRVEECRWQKVVFSACLDITPAHTAQCAHARTCVRTKCNRLTSQSSSICEVITEPQYGSLRLARSISWLCAQYTSRPSQNAQ